MKKTVYICDRCGKQVDERGLDDRLIPCRFEPYGLISKSMELCHNCQKEWAEFGKQFLKEREEKC